MTDPTNVPEPRAPRASRASAGASDIHAELRNLLDARSVLREALGRRVLQHVSATATPGPRGDARAWTPDQVLQHLALVEALVLRRMPAAASGRFRERRPWIGRLMLRVVFGLGLRVRVPVAGITPGPPTEPASILSTWSATAKALDGALIEALLGNPEGPTLVHPVAGALTPCETARFLLDHLRHHARQLDRLGVPP